MAVLRPDRGHGGHWCGPRRPKKDVCDGGQSGRVTGSTRDPAAKPWRKTLGNKFTTRQYIDLRRDLKTSSALRAPSKVPVFLPGCQKLHVIADNYQLLILTAPVVVWFRRVCFCDSGAQGKFWAFCTRFLTPKRPKNLARAFGQAFGRHHSLSALDR